MHRAAVGPRIRRNRQDTAADRLDRAGIRERTVGADRQCLRDQVRRDLTIVDEIVSAADLYLTAEKAARLLDVSVPTLYAYVSRKLIRSERIEGSRARKYWKADIDRLRGSPGPRDDANPPAPLAVHLASAVFAHCASPAVGEKTGYIFQIAGLNPYNSTVRDPCPGHHRSKMK